MLMSSRIEAREVPGELCLKTGVLTPVASLQIGRLITEDVNLDSQDVSKAANLTSNYIKQIGSSINILTSNPFTQPKYTVGGRRVFRVDATPEEGYQSCALEGGKILRINNNEESKEATAIMVKENLDYIPTNLIAKKGSIMYEDGSFYSKIPDDLKPLTPNLTKSIITLKKEGNLYPLSPDTKAKIGQLCETKMTFMRYKNSTRKTYNKNLKKVATIIPAVQRVLNHMINLHESPSAMKATLDGEIYRMEPSSKLLDLLSISKEMAPPLKWVNTKLSMVRKLYGAMKKVASMVPTSKSKTNPLPLNDLPNFARFLQLPEQGSISPVNLTAVARTSAVNDHLFNGISQTYYSGPGDNLIIYKFAPMIDDGKIVDINFVGKYKNIQFTTPTIPQLQCMNGTQFCLFHQPRLRYDSVQCANFVFERAASKRENCPLKEVDFPIAARISTCSLKNNFVISSPKKVVIDADCRQVSKQVVIEKGTHFSYTNCRLLYNGIEILSEKEDGVIFQPPSFNYVNVEVAAYTWNDILIYILSGTLTSLIIFLVSAKIFKMCRNRGEEVVQNITQNPPMNMQQRRGSSAQEMNPLNPQQNVDPNAPNMPGTRPNSRQE